MNLDINTTEGLNNVAILLKKNRSDFVPPIFEIKYAPEGYTYFCDYNVYDTDNVFFGRIACYIKNRSFFDEELYFFTTRIDPNITHNIAEAKIGNYASYSQPLSLKEIEIFYVASSRGRNAFSFFDENSRRLFYEMLDDWEYKVIEHYLPSEFYVLQMFGYVAENYGFRTNRYRNVMFILQDNSGTYEETHLYITDYRSYYLNLQSLDYVIDITEDMEEDEKELYREFFELIVDDFNRTYMGIGSTYNYFNEILRVLGIR